MKLWYNIIVVASLYEKQNVQKSAHLSDRLIEYLPQSNSTALQNYSTPPQITQVINAECSTKYPNVCKTGNGRRRLFTVVLKHCNRIHELGSMQWIRRYSKEMAVMHESHFNA